MKLSNSSACITISISRKTIKSSTASRLLLAGFLSFSVCSNRLQLFSYSWIVCWVVTMLGSTCELFYWTFNKRKGVKLVSLSDQGPESSEQTLTIKSQKGKLGLMQMTVILASITLVEFVYRDQGTLLTTAGAGPPPPPTLSFDIRNWSIAYGCCC